LQNFVISDMDALHSLNDSFNLDKRNYKSVILLRDCCIFKGLFTFLRMIHF